MIWLCNQDFQPDRVAAALPEAIFTDSFEQSDNVPLIRWGNDRGSDSPLSTLNGKRALVNALDRAEMMKIFQLNRIRTPKVITIDAQASYPVVAKYRSKKSGKSDVFVSSPAQLKDLNHDFCVRYIQTIKDYKAWVADAQVIYLELKVPVKSNTTAPEAFPSEQYEPIPINLDADSAKISLLAIKAVHLLGLDFAQVRLGLDSRKRPVVLDLNPCCELNKKTTDKFIRYIKQHLNRLYNPTDPPEATLGTDPEFVLRDNRTNRLVYPSGFISKGGLLGYDDRSERRQGQFYPLAEIRPAPDACPLKLTEKVRKALQYGITRIPYKNIEWLAGSLHFDRYQIGGHIHYSGIKPNASLLRVLDNYLAIPIRLIEDPIAGAKRRTQYGGLGNIRFKPHGGFEYRTLGSWLVTPDITKAVLCLAKVAASAFPHLKRNYFVSFETQKAFYDGNSQILYDIFPLIWNDLKHTASFKLYHKELSIIKDMVTNRKTWNEDSDFRTHWGLSIPSRILI